MSRSHLPAPTVVNLQQAFKSWEDWVGVMSPADGYTDISVDRHEYQVTIPPICPHRPPPVLRWLLERHGGQPRRVAGSPGSLLQVRPCLALW